MKNILGIFLSLFLVPTLSFASGGTLNLSPGSGIYPLNQPFSVVVEADTGGTSVNAVEGELHYDPAGLMVDSISIEGSILTSFATTPSYDSASGLIHFSGWTSQSYNGKAGKLITITFRLLKLDETRVVINSGAMLDKSGSNILTTLIPGLYSGIPAQGGTPSLPLVEGAETEAAPSISHFETAENITTETPIIAKGAATPDTRINIYLQTEAGELKKSSIISAPDGSFTYVSEPIVETGAYALWAEAENSAGKSPPTEHARVIVRSDQVAAAFSAGLGLLGAFLPVFIALLALAFLVAYFLHRRGRSNAA